MPTYGGALLGNAIRTQVEASVTGYRRSRLERLVDQTGEPPLAIKFVPSEWATHYAVPRALKISTTPALTWGTGTYVTPLAFPLSSVLYGRVGVVTTFDPTDWRIFDATTQRGRRAYMDWARTQPNFDDVILTVHATFTNHELRNKFRKDFHIDCVLFQPDQEAELHTDLSQHVWMLVTDWMPDGTIETEFSGRLASARFTVLIDEEFALTRGAGLPIQVAPRKIEAATTVFASPSPLPISRARIDPSLPAWIAKHYFTNSYLHIYVEP